MRIFIDGDSCSIIQTTETIAKQYDIECHIYCDTKRILESDYSKVHIVDYGPDAVDFAIIKECGEGDIVITNDTELASIALVRHSIVINSKGIRFTRENLTPFLAGRYLRYKEARRTGKKQVKKSSMKGYVVHESYYKTLSTIIRAQKGKKR